MTHQELEAARSALVVAAVNGITDARASSLNNGVSADVKVQIEDDHSFSVILASGETIHFNTTVI